VPPDTSPILDTTIENIRKLLENSAGRGTLPPVRSMARQFGVSPVTVMRAVRVLESNGVLTSRWGKGIAKKGTVTPPSTTGVRDGSTFERTLERFRNDIFRGYFRTHLPLPPVNQLTARYDVSYPTIRKVLSALLSENILKRNGARYYFFTNRPARHPRIAIIAFGEARETIKIETERERTFFRNLSSIAADNNVDLEILCYNDYLEKPHFYTPHNEPLQQYLKTAGICGIILSSYHMNNSAECLATLLSLNIPVSAWIEDSGILSTVDRFGSYYRKLTFFDSSYSTIPGNDVGRHLLEKGHRTIAFISPFHGSPWSRNRFKGLTKAATIHPDATLHQFTATEYINDYYYMLPFLEKNDAGCTTLSHALKKRVHRFLAPRLSAIKQEHDTLLRDNAIFASVKNAVDRITADESVTALVCVNDLVAGLITDYWDFQQIPSRRRPALFGFDNSFTSIRKQISSYEFNTHGEIQNMINHVLYPDTTLFNRNRPVIRLKGTVIERASSESGNCRQKA
jgi:DNA-binding GntR family transcriptional regulator/DNA-binding LacI/PurR family transcriptional regulator